MERLHHAGEADLVQDLLGRVLRDLMTLDFTALPSRAPGRRRGFAASGLDLRRGRDLRDRAAVSQRLPGPPGAPKLTGMSRKMISFIHSARTSTERALGVEDLHRRVASIVGRRALTMAERIDEVPGLGLVGVDVRDQRRRTSRGCPHRRCWSGRDGCHRRPAGSSRRPRGTTASRRCPARGRERCARCCSRAGALRVVREGLVEQGVHVEVHRGRRRIGGGHGLVRVARRHLDVGLADDVDVLDIAAAVLVLDGADVVEVVPRPGT